MYRLRCGFGALWLRVASALAVVSTFVVLPLPLVHDVASMRPPLLIKMDRPLFLLTVVKRHPLPHRTAALLLPIHYVWPLRRLVVMRPWPQEHSRSRGVVDEQQGEQESQELSVSFTVLRHRCRHQ